MARNLAGYVGQIPSIASSFVRRNGIWTLEEYFQAKAGDGWPVASVGFNIEYLVIAGGGGSYNSDGGGGGGGYRTNLSGESSGGGAAAESPLQIYTGFLYSVTVGAGGGVTSNGSSSVFSSITSIGGGTGGASGGSGGGANSAQGSASGPLGTANQGYAGGGLDHLTGSEWYCPYTPENSDCIPYSGGGGGAGSAGSDGYAISAGATVGGAGGNGVASSVTGSSVTRAGGGGGDGGSNGSGGGNTANLGGGGGNSSGGSGIVILRYPTSYVISNPEGGLIMSTSTVGGSSVTQITAGTGNVYFAEA